MEHSLDVRGLGPPAPMEHILDELADMSDDDYLHVFLDINPIPLYPLLSSMGYRWYRKDRDHGPVDLYIWPSGGAVPDALME